MAGPLSSEEIEDVVSSVRRLVSNEQRPRPQSRNLNAETLLLTPAFRVVADPALLAPLVLDAPLIEPAAEVPASDLAEMQPVEMAVEMAVETGAATGAETVTEPEDLSPAQADSLARALDMDIEADPPAGEGGRHSASGPVSQPDTGTAEADWEDQSWADPAPMSLGEAALSAEEAELLTIGAPEDGDAVGDGADPVWTEDRRVWSEEEPVPFVPLRRRAEHLAARLAAGEVTEAPPVAAEALSEMTPNAEPPNAEPLVAPAAQAFAPAPMATELIDVDGTPLAVLDEAALHEIVRQTLRNELQGEMGERITRNVRKLVRAEIHRALMARDLD